MDTSLERRIVQILACEPNQSLLEQLINSQNRDQFQYIASEMPILTDQGYGFIDIIGGDLKHNSLTFVECKTNEHLLPSALHQIRNYRRNCELFGAIQKRNLIGLYHQIIHHAVNTQSIPLIKPLILNNKVLLKQVGQSLQELLSKCRTFMIKWIASNYQIPQSDFEVVPKNSIPIYVINRKITDDERSYVGYYNLKSALEFTQLPTISSHAPLKLEPDTSNYTTYQKMNSKGSKQFAIFFHIFGHSRPMLFFEINSSYSVCFIHTGQHLVELNGYYETSKIMENTNRIYGLTQIERGHYFITKSGNNRLEIDLHGQKSHGKLSFTFLDNIYMDNDINIDSTQRYLNSFI